MMNNGILDVKTSKLNILLVDDDWIDRKAVQRAFKNINFGYNITEAIDGKEALEILAENGFDAVTDMDEVVKRAVELASQAA